MAGLYSFESFAGCLTEDLVFFPAEYLRAGFEEIAGEKELFTAGFHEGVGEFRIEADRAVVRDGPGRRGPDNHVAAGGIGLGENPGYGGIVEATPLLRLQYSWYQTMDYVRIVRLSLQMLLSGAAGVNDLSGPVGIVSTITEVGKETEAEAGFGAALESILYFAAMFAVNLAVMNLLPLPALDGGHVLFLLVNGIAVALFKKEIPSKYLNVINGIGFALLMALMLFVTFHDIVKLL